MNVLVWCGSRGIPLRGTSGASEHLRALARALARAGHAVRVATPSAEDHRGVGGAFELPSVHLAHRWPAGLRTLGARLDGHLRWRAAAAPPPDLVWERFDATSAAPARRAGRRFVEVDAPLAWERRWPERPRARELDREDRVLAGAERVFAVSRWLRDHLIAERGVAAARVRHLPNGVDPRPADREAARAALDIRGRTLVFVGSMHRWHGADRLPELLDALGPGWTALVAGDGPHPPADHPRLRRLGRIPPDAVWPLLAAGDVGLAPYDPAGPPWFCPLKVLQYRAAGLPVVGTATGDTAELIGASGFALADRRASAWAEAVVAAAALPRAPWIRTWDRVVAEGLGPAPSGPTL